MGAFRMNRISESMHVAKRGEVRLEEPGGSSSLFDGIDNGRSASRITSVHQNMHAGSCKLFEDPTAKSIG
jgi:hypothetical protein